MIGDNRNYDEIVAPLSPKVFNQMAQGIEKARARNAATQNVTYNSDNRVIVQGGIIDKDGFNKAVSEANRDIQRRTGVEIYGRRSVY